MACLLSQEQRESKLRNKLIEDNLKKTRRELRQEIKLLLLGAGESGKSTVVKQMRIIHGAGYSDKERRDFIAQVYINIVRNMRVLLEGAESFERKLKSRNEEHANTIWNYESNEASLFVSEILPALECLLEDEAVLHALEQRNKLQLNDSAEYYFNDLDRIGQDEYLPTNQDILRSRVATTGIVEFKFCMNNKTNFRMIDVGGQRSERRKWIHCFEDVTAITFIVACSGYDQVCIEDDATNRMEESLSLWEQIATYPLFQKASMILFLNKVDLLEQKIKTSHLVDWFPDFTGQKGDAEAAKVFIKEMFRECAKNELGRSLHQIYDHYTTATDTNNIQIVIDSVRDTILQHNLRAYAVV